jgi:YHS domain-containing protein
MNLLSWLLRILLILFLVRALWRLAVGLFEGMTGRQQVRGRRLDRAVPLARDPVCGTYVVPERAPSAAAGGSTYYFCSEECRRAFQAKERAGRTA